jgi:hypothetical protein
LQAYFFLSPFPHQVLYIYMCVSSLRRRPKMTLPHTCTKIYTHRLERHTENRWWSRCGPNCWGQRCSKRWIEGLDATLFYTPACAALAVCFSCSLRSCEAMAALATASSQRQLAQDSWDMCVTHPSTGSGGYSILQSSKFTVTPHASCRVDSVLFFLSCFYYRTNF